MASHHDFLRRLLADPADDVTRLVYADWLDDRGDPDSGTRAAFIRAEYAWAALEHRPDAPGRAALEHRLRSLALVLPTRWKAAVGNADVWHPRPDGAGCCPVRWDRLAVTRDRKTRACGRCGRTVVYCTTAGQALHHAGGWQPVALDRAVLPTDADPQFVQFQRLVRANGRMVAPVPVAPNPYGTWLGPTTIAMRVRRR